MNNEDVNLRFKYIAYNQNKKLLLCLISSVLNFENLLFCGISVLVFLPDLLIPCQKALVGTLALEFLIRNFIYTVLYYIFTVCQKNYELFTQVPVVGNGNCLKVLSGV